MADKMSLMITLVVVVVTTMMVNVGQVECGCYNLTKAYLECKYLKLALVNGTYVPDRNITGNYLNDSIVSVKEKLSNKTALMYALSLFATIFERSQLTGRRCTPECQCLKSAVAAEGNYSIFFRDSKNVAGVHQILQEFITAFAKNQTSYQNLVASGVLPNENLTTLGQFCYTNEYSELRSQFYNQSVFNCSITPDPNYLYSWFYEKSVINRVPQFTPALEQEFRLGSLLLPFTKCPLQTQRYLAMLNWQSQVASLVPSGRWTYTYFDIQIKSLINKPKILFTPASINISQWNIDITTVNGTKAGFLFDETVATTYTDVCFNSSQLLIECTFDRVNEGASYGLTYLNYTFRFPNVKILKQRTFAYGFNVTAPVFVKNKPFVAAPVDGRLMHVQPNPMDKQQSILHEFLTNTVTVVSKDFLAVFFPTKLVNGTSVQGLLVEPVIVSSWAAQVY